MISQIDVSLFWISKILTHSFLISENRIPDIKNNNFGFMKINIYFRYQKLLFWISKIIVSDIRNYAVKVFYLRYPKDLFWISRIIISDIPK